LEKKTILESRFEMYLIIGIALSCLLALLLALKRKKSNPRQEQMDADVTGDVSTPTAKRLRNRKQPQNRHIPLPHTGPFEDPDFAAEVLKEHIDYLGADTERELSATSEGELCVKCQRLARKAACPTSMCRDCCVKANGINCNVHTTLLQRTSVRAERLLR
jgi:hypothetical protein